MRNKLVLAALFITGAITFAATAPFASGASTKAPSSVKISSRSITGLGTVLVSSKGRTLYVFAPDKGKRVTCGTKEACATVWPPQFISTTGKPVAGPGVKQSLLGSDPDPFAPGKRVVTYKGWPLYAYVADSKNGVATGQDTNGSGGYWYVITTTGSVIKHKASKGTTTNTTTTTTTTATNTTTTNTTTTTSSCGAAGDDQDGDGDHSGGGVDDGDGGCI